MATRAWNEIYETDPSKIGDVTTLMGGLRGLAGAASGGLANRFIGMSSTPTKAAESATGEATPSNISEAFTPRAGAVSVPLSPIVPAVQMVSGTTPSMKAPYAQAAASGAATGTVTGTSQTTPTPSVTRTSLEGAADRAVAVVPGAKEYAEKNAFSDRMAMRNLVKDEKLGVWLPSPEAQAATIKSIEESSAREETARLARSSAEDRERENRLMRIRAQDIQNSKLSLLTDARLAAQAGRHDEARSLISLLQASGGIAPMDFAAATRAQTEQDLAPQLGMKYAAEAEREKALAGTAPMTAEKILAETDRQRAEAEKARTEAKLYPELLKTKSGVSEQKEVSAEAARIRADARRYERLIAEASAGAIPNPQLVEQYKINLGKLNKQLQALTGAA